MTDRSHALQEKAADYIRDLALMRERKELASLRAATQQLDKSDMQISVEQGQLMGVLVKLTGARRAIELGTFTGYSTLAVAQYLPEDGLLVACDISEEWTSVGKPFWEDAGVDGRIDLRLAPATETLTAMIDAGEGESYDFAFIDADKRIIADYYELCLTLVRPGGLIVVDNIFMRGSGVDPGPKDKQGIAIKAMTEAAFADDRVDPAIVPISDGMMIAYKR